MANVQITVVVDNTVRRPGLLAEHGLSFLIESGDAKILFDTGQGLAWPNNERRMQLPSAELNAVVLSHGHYDHTGGLGYVLEKAQQAAVYVHPAALAAKYGRRVGERVRRIGIAPEHASVLRTRTPATIWTKAPTQVAADVWVTGEIPRRTSFEDTGGGFYLDEACREVDPLLDDQALYLETSKGLVVVLGCTHSGVVNTLDYVSALAKRDHVHAILGGTHLIRASRERLEATAEALKRYNVEVIAAGHCTGAVATAFLRGRFPAQSAELSVGASFRF